MKPSDLNAYLGKKIFKSDVIMITKRHLDLFMELSNDRQLIHSEHQIVHGNLLLSLFVLPIPIDSENYQLFHCGFKKVRFYEPSRIGDSLQSVYTLKEIIVISEMASDMLIEIIITNVTTNRKIANIWCLMRLIH